MALLTCFRLLHSICLGHHAMLLVNVVRLLAAVLWKKALFDDPKRWLCRRLNLLGTLVLLIDRLTTEFALVVYLHFQTIIIEENRLFRYKFVSKQVISIQTQALKLLEKLITSSTVCV